MSQSLGAGNRVERMVDMASLFYKACHLPQPAVLFTNSQSDYQDCIESFAPLNGPDGTRPELLMMLICMPVASVALVCTPPALSWLSGNDVFDTLLILAIPAAGLLMIVCCMAIGAIVKSAIKKRARLRLLRTNKVFASKPLSSDLLFRGALPTPDGMIGALAGAIQDNGGKVERDPEGTQSNWARQCLHIGGQHDGGEHGLVIQSIQDWVRLNMSLETQSQQPAPQSHPVLLERILSLAMQAPRVTLLDGMVIIQLDSVPSVLDKQLADNKVPDMSAIAPGLIYRLYLCKLGMMGKDTQVVKTRRLVRRAAATSDLVLQDYVYHQAGMDQTVAILDAKPAIEDETGSLYRLGINSSVLCYVRVKDQVVGPDGMPLVHWISVPQYISSPREGVAWSFALREQAYKPTAEA